MADSFVSELAARDNAATPETTATGPPA